MADLILAYVSNACFGCPNGHCNVVQVPVYYEENPDQGFGDIPCDLCEEDMVYIGPTS